MASTVDKQDPRYAVLRRSRNARFPRVDTDAVARIEVCESAADATRALERALADGLRPTIRSGGHCYEDFTVNNPNGVLIDLSMLNHTAAAQGNKAGFEIGPGAMLGVVYAELFRKDNATLPGGSCYSVGMGGHLSGGGYGLLTRLYGLSVDWMTAVDILTVDSSGKVIPRRVDRNHDPELFRALRGSGGASYGVITNFLFDRLPPAPRTLSTAGVYFPWETMTEDQFLHIAQTYGDYFATRGQEPDTWPLFTFMGLSHKSPNGRIGISASWHHIEAGDDLSIPNEFLDRFLKCGGALTLDPAPVHAHQPGTGRPPDPLPCVAGRHRFTSAPWIDATVSNGGGPGGNSTTRGKYKSCYMKKNFTSEELRRMYAHLTRDIPGISMNCTVAVDSYGGAVNRLSMAEETSIPQRASILKLQYMMYWQDPAEDAARLRYFDEFYTDVYSAHVDRPYTGTPFHNQLYEGCYINYPDLDMTRYPFWPELYYGTQGLYPMLQSAKQRYDPHNIFHHGMTVRPKAETV